MTPSAYSTSDITRQADFDCVALTGMIATMKSENDVFEGYVVIRGDTIENVFDDTIHTSELGCDNIIKIDGYILPGLIDAHNHPSWNIIPLWDVPAKYDDRYQWQTIPESYNTTTKWPHQIVTSANYYNYTIEAMKYSQSKALVGGTTVLQGTSWNDAKQKEGFAYFIEHLIELEHPDNIYTKSRVPNISTVDNKKLVEQLDSGKYEVYIQHLAEGTDNNSTREFDILKQYGLLRNETVIIHGTGINKTGFEQMANDETKLTWSPLSNLLLYGGTTDIKTARGQGVLTSLSPDWSPSGSKNVLQELKVAAWWNVEELENSLSPYELAQMVTSNPAKAIRWDNYSGMISQNNSADILIINQICEKQNTCLDPFESLILAGDSDVKLVLVKGKPLYGEIQLLTEFGVSDYDIVGCLGWKKGIILKNPAVDKGGQSMNEIADLLDSALKFDKDDMYNSWGKDLSGIHSKSQFDEWFDEKYPGIQPIDLSGLYTSCDEQYLETLVDEKNYDFSELVSLIKYANHLDDTKSLSDFESYIKTDLGKKPILPPKKQLEAGILPHEITCKDGFELIFKSKNGLPVCVKPSTADRLTERGWGHS